jgi:hypothetical protein
LYRAETRQTKGLFRLKCVKLMAIVRRSLAHLSQNNSGGSATKSRLNFSQPTHLIHSIGPKTYVLGHLGPFRYCTKVNAILDELAPLTPKFAK